MMYCSFSKWSSTFLNPPRARARSFATLGFSAIIRDLDIFSDQEVCSLENQPDVKQAPFPKGFPEVRLGYKSLRFKGEDARRDSSTWQIGFRSGGHGVITTRTSPAYSSRESRARFTAADSRGTVLMISPDKSSFFVRANSKRDGISLPR